MATEKKKLKKIVGPSDPFRGPAIGHSPEHGDNWMTVVDKMNAAIDALNEGGLSSTASSTPTVDKGAADRLEKMEADIADLKQFLFARDPATDISPKPTEDSSGVTANDSTPAPAASPAPLATFDGEAGNPVGSTVDKSDENNRFVISGADGRTESESYVEEQGQKPGQEPDANADAEPLTGMAKLADAEQKIEASLQSPDVSTIPADADPMQAVDDKNHPPSGETLERADANALNNTRSS